MIGGWFNCIQFPPMGGSPGRSRPMILISKLPWISVLTVQRPPMGQPRKFIARICNPVVPIVSLLQYPKRVSGFGLSSGLILGIGWLTIGRYPEKEMLFFKYLL